MPRTPSAAYEMQFGDPRYPPSVETAPSDVVMHFPETPTSKTIMTKWHGLPSPQTPPGSSDASILPFTVASNNNQGERSGAPVDVFWVDECVEPQHPSVSPITTRSASVLGSTSVAYLPGDGKLTPTVSLGSATELTREASSSPSARRSMRIRDKLNTRGRRFLNQTFLQTKLIFPKRNIISIRPSKLSKLQRLSNP